MSTRAVYCFKDLGTENEFMVYSHYDNYPTGALIQLNNAFKFAWRLPRFEADEFAAAFVAGNKKEGGMIRLMNITDDLPSDIEYVYDIYFDTKKEKLMIKVFDYNTDPYLGAPVFKGTFDKFKKFTKSKENIYG